MGGSGQVVLLVRAEAHREHAAACALLRSYEAPVDVSASELRVWLRACPAVPAGVARDATTHCEVAERLELVADRFARRARFTVSNDEGR